MIVWLEKRMHHVLLLDRRLPFDQLRYWNKSLDRVARQWINENGKSSSYRQTWKMSLDMHFSTHMKCKGLRGIMDSNSLKSQHWKTRNGILEGYTSNITQRPQIEKTQARLRLVPCTLLIQISFSSGASCPCVDSWGCLYSGGFCVRGLGVYPFWLAFVT